MKFSFCLLIHFRWLYNQSNDDQTTKITFLIKKRISLSDMYYILIDFSLLASNMKIFDLLQIKVFTPYCVYS